MYHDSSHSLLHNIITCLVLSIVKLNNERLSKNSSCPQFGKLLQDCIHKLAVSRHMSIASVSMKHTQYTCMQTHTHTEEEVMNVFDWSTSLHQKGMCEITKGYEGRRWHWQGTQCAIQINYLYIALTPTQPNHAHKHTHKNTCTHTCTPHTHTHTHYCFYYCMMVDVGSASAKLYVQSAISAGIVVTSEW